MNMEPLKALMGLPRNVTLGEKVGNGCSNPMKPASIGNAPCTPSHAPRLPHEARHVTVICGNGKPLSCWLGALPSVRHKGT